MDPLSVLRDYATRGHLDKVTRTAANPAAEIHFLNPNNPSSTAYSFPAAVETPYRSKQGTPYTLDSLLFFLQNQQLKHTDYLQSARNLSIPAVTFTDRKPLLDFLLSKSSSSLPILPPLPLPDEPPAKRPALANPGPSHNRPPRSEGGDDANDYDNTIVDVMEMIRSVERPLKDREGILLCRNRDFYGVLVSSMKREEERQRMEMQQRKDGLVAKSRLMGVEDRGLGLGFGGGGEELRGFGDAMGSSGTMGSSGGKSKLGVKKVGGDGVPIILVPSAFQTLITIYNVKEFLEDGVYVPTEVKVKGMGKKPEVVTVHKKFASSRERGGVRAAYEVRDKVTGLKSDDWERVIAAFVLGKEWQFKDWPFKDHVEIFNKILGFFLRFEDDSVESAKNVKQWNVKIISISKNKRHQDRAAALEVWDRLEEFMRARSRA